MRRLALAAFLLALAASCGAPAGRSRRLDVAAAASLRDVLERAAPAFRAAHPDVELAFSFEASSTLARQVREGASYAVFLSADAAVLDIVADREVPGTRRVFLANRLALLGPADARGLSPATADPLRSVICGPEVPAGKAWRAWLGKGGGPDPARLQIAQNPRAALALFEAGTVDFAYVYATDARAARRPHAVWTPPDAPEVTYVAAALRSPADAPARAFLDWLASREFRDAALAEGFLEASPR